ncbi:MAG TPA: GntR family transcriptional regulator [Solirubrobacteraceae bacterium]|nr:GntR family transcriptional regulator [Solirubrobacteraceae bacterium]
MSEQQSGKPPIPTPDFETLVVDRGAEVPIGIQLAWSLRSRIGDGRLAPGQRLPGLRDLAEASGVNVNTVRAVYQRLEQEGLIESQQGTGTFVATTPRKHSPVGTIAAGAAREAYATGVDPREVAAALYVTAEPYPESGDSAAEQRRALRAQIAALERTVVEMESAYPGLLAPSPTTSAGIGPALLSVDELEHVRAGLVRRLATIQSAIDSLSRPAAVDELPAVPARMKKAAPQPVASTPKKRSPRPLGGARPAPAGS